MRKIRFTDIVQYTRAKTPRQESEQQDMSNEEPKSDTVPISQPRCHNSIYIENIKE